MNLNSRLSLMPYRPAPMVTGQPLDRYPRLAIEDGQLGRHIDRAGCVERAADNIGYLLGELYPNATWSN